jgi:hypothetical protein
MLLNAPEAHAGLVYGLRNDVPQSLNGIADSGFAREDGLRLFCAITQPADQAVVQHIQRHEAMRRLQRLAQHLWQRGRVWWVPQVLTHARGRRRVAAFWST